MKGKYIWILISIVLLYGLSVYSGFTTLVIPISKYEFRTGKKMRKGEIVQPLKNLDFDSGKWVVYLVISPNDFKDLHPLVSKATCLKTDNVELLKEMRKKWNFKYTGGDMATVSSAIYFFRNGDLVFESGIVIDKNAEGLQSEQYGWLEPIEKDMLSENGRQFKRVYWPIIFI